MDMDFVALDLETADRRNEAPCSIALVLVQDGEIAKEQQFYIDPETEFNPFAIRVHGITPQKVAGCPTFPDIWPQLSDILRKYPIVAHNAAFDIRVLEKAATRYGLSFVSPTVYCTLQLAMKNYDLPSYSLDSLCRNFGITLDRHHNSLCDAEACAKLMIRYIDEGIRITPGFSLTDTSKRKTDKKRLRPADVVCQSENIDRSNPLYGQKIVFTGQLSMDRQDAMQIAVDHGAEIRSSVSKLTDILVVGTQDLSVVGSGGHSTKEKKAVELNETGQAHILIINETKFLALANNEVDYMNEQLSFDLPSDGEKHTTILEQLRTSLLETLEKNWLSDTFLVSTANQKSSSLYLLNKSNLIIRVKEADDRFYLSVPESISKHLPSTLKYRKDKSRKDYIEITIDNGDITPEHICAAQVALQATLDAITCDFGCCGKYKECSDVKQCVHPDKQVSLSCYYRRNLLQGKIFYGKNKNI